MIVIMIIVGIISVIGFKLTEEKEKVQDVMAIIGGFAVILSIILTALHIFAGNIFKTTVSSQDTVYEITSFSQTVTLTETSYIIKVDDNTNTTYILSDHDSDIEIDYQGNQPTTMTITQNVLFDYCTFETTENKIYKIH